MRWNVGENWNLQLDWNSHPHLAEGPLLECLSLSTISAAANLPAARLHQRISFVSAPGNMGIARCSGEKVAIP